VANDAYAYFHANYFQSIAFIKEERLVSSPYIRDTDQKGVKTKVPSGDKQKDADPDKDASLETFGTNSNLFAIIQSVNADNKT